MLCYFKTLGGGGGGAYWRGGPPFFTKAIGISSLYTIAKWKIWQVQKIEGHKAEDEKQL